MRVPSVSARSRRHQAREISTLIVVHGLDEAGTPARQGGLHAISHPAVIGELTHDGHGKPPPLPGSRHSPRCEGACCPADPRPRRCAGAVLPANLVRCRSVASTSHVFVAARADGRPGNGLGQAAGNRVAYNLFDKEYVVTLGMPPGLQARGRQYPGHPRQRKGPLALGALSEVLHKKPSLPG